MTTQPPINVQSDLSYHSSHAVGLLLHPMKEWEGINAEVEEDHRQARYVLVLSLLPAISLFLGIISIGGRFAGPTIKSAIFASFVVWFIELLAWFISLFAILFVARKFGSAAPREQIGRLAAFSFTPFWLLSVVLIVAPQEIVLSSIVGLCWTIYLIYLGAPILSGIVAEKSAAFAMSVGGACIVSFFIARAIVRVVL